MEQRTDEWYAARVGKATASRFGDIMAYTKSGESASRKNYRAQLVIERITGEREPGYTTAPMQWGIDNEPTARLAYMSETGNEVVEAPFMEHGVLQAGASPDGFVGDEGLLEIKCPNSATHIETLRKHKVPSLYMAQIQGQLWITGRLWCDFVSFDPRLPGNAQLFILRVKRDDLYIEDLEEQVANFLEEVDQECDFIKSYKG